MAQRLVPLKEYAKEVGIPESTLRWQVKQGQMPNAQRVGRYWYVAVEVAQPTGPARVFTLFTHAGGAGKSSLTRDLGFELFARSYRVLLIDADPQANLTAWLGINPVDVSPNETLMRVVEDRTLPPPRQVLAGIHLIPAHMRLALAEVALPHKPFGSGQLRSALRRSGALEQYDVILIDSPPSLGPLAALAALAGDGLIVPVETSPKGVQGVLGVVEVARDYKQILIDHGLAANLSRFIRLFVPTRYDPRTVQDQRVLEALREIEGVAPVAPPLAYRPAIYKQACDEAQPVQAVGDEKTRQEMAQLGDLFLSATRFEEATWV